MPFFQRDHGLPREAKCEASSRDSSLTSTTLRMTLPPPLPQFCQWCQFCRYHSGNKVSKVKMVLDSLYSIISTH